MKQALAAILLPAVLLFNACTWCTVQCKPSSPQNTYTQITEKAQTEPQAQAPAPEAPAEVTPTKEPLTVTEVPPAVKEEEKPLALGPSTTVPKGPAAAKTPQLTEDEKAKIPQSFIDGDGRYLHPWAAKKPTKNYKDYPAAPFANEKMQFGVHYGIIRAGTAYISTKGITQTDFGPAFMIETLANSAKVIDAVFKVRDINYSWISVKDYSSFGYSQSIREGNYVRDEWLTFDVPAKKYTGVLKKKNNPSKIEGALTGPVQDMLTSLFYVRMQDLDSKKDIIFDVANREKMYPLQVKILGKETVKVPAGKFNCIVVEPGFRGEGIFTQKGKSLKVWITDDERRMPVKMETQVFIGKVSASLEEYSS